MTLPRFALTPGEPAGIGPDLCLLLAREAQPAPLVAIASRELLAERARQLGLSIELLAVEPQRWPDAPAAEPKQSMRIGEIFPQQIKELPIIRQGSTRLVSRSLSTR